MDERQLYRITVETFTRKVLYCGSNRDMARLEFHRSQPTDHGSTDGNNQFQLTLCEEIEDANTGGDFVPDEARKTSAE